MEAKTTQIEISRKTIKVGGEIDRELEAADIRRLPYVKTGT